MRGTIVINADAGRALRKRRAALLATDMLWCIGDFCVGDQVYIVMRGADGGQGVIATGTARYAAAELRKAIDRMIDASDARSEVGDPIVVIAEQDVALLWPSGS